MTEKLKEIQVVLDECYAVTMGEKHNCNSTDTPCFARHQRRVQEAQLKCEETALEQTKAPPTELIGGTQKSRPSLTT